MDPRTLLARASESLLSHRTDGGFWEGHLSSSALSTSTAVAALALHTRAVGAAAAEDDTLLVRRGIEWLVTHRNSDGGWGDTVASRSNISTTLLAWAALAFAEGDDARTRAAAQGAEAWITATAGGFDATRLSAAITARYGRDRTFSVPILTMCALAGRLGDGPVAWQTIPALPFELGTAPRALFAWLRLPVVSYALPALIAMGLARHRRNPTRNPITRALRDLTTARALRVLDALQPSNGGFLEATPLTSFVAMSLVGADEAGHVVVRRALRFIRASVRTDGSWPIDTHLSTWVTTLAVNALHGSGALERMDTAGLSSLRQWIVEQQHAREHVYTGAAPGGWAWTPLPGGVPDADDTAGAILALALLPPDDDGARAAAAGIEWLLGLQNRDGGVPTFCRGWGALPFDRSGADLTAHAIRAWNAWLGRLAPELQDRVVRALDRGLDYLERSQRPDGAFLPLWFGNESAPDETNATYGTARVVAALAAVRQGRERRIDPMLARGVRWLVQARNPDGGWGGDRGVRSSVEETALAVGALADCCAVTGDAMNARDAVAAGCQWLAAATDDGSRFPASPIGLYFAKLWYSESLYPLLFAVEALGSAARALDPAAT